MLWTLTGHASGVIGCAYSPDGTRIVSASYDNTLKVWDGEGGDALRTLTGHADWVRGCAYSPDGIRIVSASSDNTLKVWDARDGHCLATFYADGALWDCSWNPVSNHIVAVGGKGVYFLEFIDTTGGRLPR